MIDYVAGNERPLTVQELDGRTRVAKALAELRRDLLEAQGGDQATPQVELLVERIVTDQLILGSLEAFLQGAVIDGKIVDTDKHGRLAVAPLFRERAYLADSMARRLALLGLEAAPKQQKDLDGHLAEKYGARTIDAGAPETIEAGALRSNADAPETIEADTASTRSDARTRRPAAITCDDDMPRACDAGAPETIEAETVPPARAKA